RPSPQRIVRRTGRRARDRISGAPIPEDETLREPARLGLRHARPRDDRRGPLPVPDSRAVAEEPGRSAHDRRDAHTPHVKRGAVPLFPGPMIAAWYPVLAGIPAAAGGLTWGAYHPASPLFGPVLRRLPDDRTIALTFD